MIQAQRVQEALDWFPEILRDAFCMGDQTDHCLGGLFSSENTAAKSLGRGFNLPVFCLVSRPIYFYMAVSESIWKSKLDYVTVLPKDLQWLHRAHKVKFELLPCPAGPCMIWLLLHCRPCTGSPTTPGPMASHHSLQTLHTGCPLFLDGSSSFSVHTCMLSCCSHVWLFATLWTIAHQAPLYMGLSRQEYWSGLPCPW